MADSPTPPVDDRRWYEGITRYQWLVLLIASLGWVFDIFEGQIFVASMNEAMPSLMEQLRQRGHDAGAGGGERVPGGKGGAHNVEFGAIEATYRALEAHAAAVLL